MPEVPEGQTSVVIELGHKPSRLMPTNTEETMHYPSLSIQDLPEDSALVTKSMKDTFTALVTLKKTGMRTRDGKAHVDLDALKMEIY